MKPTSLREAYAALDNRGPGFETLRLFAASAVVLHHAMKIEHDIVRDDWLFQFSGGYTQLGLLAVSVFFALSGYLVTPGLAKSGNVIGYLSRRFMRIMPLLATIVVGTALVIGPLVSALPPAEYFASPVTWRYLTTVTTFLSLQLPGVTDYDGGNTINGPIWTLNLEWMCYLILAALAATGALSRRWIVLTIYVAAMLVLFFGLGPIPGDQTRGRPFVMLFLFGYFGAGVVMNLFGDLIPWSKGLMLAALAALAAAYATQYDYLVAPLLTAYLVVGIGLIRFPETRLTTGVDLSYGVYLSHSVILMVLMNIHPFRSWPVLFAVTLALSYATAFLTWRFIEAPALGHKDLPEKIVRRILSRILPAREAGAV